MVQSNDCLQKTTKLVWVGFSSGRIRRFLRCAMTGLGQLSHPAGVHALVKSIGLLLKVFIEGRLGTWSNIILWIRDKRRSAK